MKQDEDAFLGGLIVTVIWLTVLSNVTHCKFSIFATNVQSTFHTERGLGGGPHSLGLNCNKWKAMQNCYMLHDIQPFYWCLHACFHLCRLLNSFQSKALPLQNNIFLFIALLPCLWCGIYAPWIFWDLGFV